MCPCAGRQQGPRRRGYLQEDRRSLRGEASVRQTGSGRVFKGLVEQTRRRAQSPAQVLRASGARRTYAVIYCQHSLLHERTALLAALYGQGGQSRRDTCNQPCSLLQCPPDACSQNCTYNTLLRRSCQTTTSAPSMTDTARPVSRAVWVASQAQAAQAWSSQTPSTFSSLSSVAVWEAWVVLGAWAAARDHGHSLAATRSECNPVP